MIGVTGGLCVAKKLESMLLRVNKLLARSGYEVKRVKHVSEEFVNLQFFLAKRNIPFVLDVGANEGQFAEKLFAAGYTGTIISFEPMPREHEILARKAAQHPRWQVAPPLALSDRSGTADFHVAGNSISSSLLPMEELHLEAAPQSAEVATLTVRLERLDAMLHTLLPEGRFLLKVDTQGSEREVLNGAAGVMDRVDGIKTEMSFVPLYSGQPLFAEIYAMVTAAGFRLADLTPGFRRKRRAQDLLQVDGLFLRPA